MREAPATARVCRPGRVAERRALVWLEDCSRGPQEDGIDDGQERTARNMRARTLVSTGLLLIATIALVSCSSTEPPAATPGDAAAAASSAAPGTEGATPPAPLEAAPLAPSDKALLTVYRKKRMVGLALHTSVHVDGVELAELENGAYVRLAVAPGPHVLHADEERDATKVELEAGKEYFCRMELVPGLWKGHGVLVPVDAATGAAEFREWKLKLTKDAKRPEMVVADPGKP